MDTFLISEAHSLPKLVLVLFFSLFWAEFQICDHLETVYDDWRFVIWSHLSIIKPKRVSKIDLISFFSNNCVACHACQSAQHGDLEITRGIDRVIPLSLSCFFFFAFANKWEPHSCSFIKRCITEFSTIPFHIHMSRNMGLIF